MVGVLVVGIGGGVGGRGLVGGWVVEGEGGAGGGEVGGLIALVT